MVRSPQGPLILPLDTLRTHLRHIVGAGIAAVSAHDLLRRALDDDGAGDLRGRRLHVVAAGKAASSMARALGEREDLDVACILAVGTHREPDLPGAVEWHTASHPVPDARSVAAARRALAIARSVPATEHLVLLLSGGASSLLCLPIDGLSLEDKQQVVRGLINGGADIHALNAVRKHLSAVKGGHLAAACAGYTTTLAVSDVVGDDLSVIGSGPGVPDPSTWQEASAAYRAWMPAAQRLPVVDALLRRGVAGELPETPKAGDRSLAQSDARVIGGRADAMRGAREAAGRLGYRVTVIDEPITGEARAAARAWLQRAHDIAAAATGPVCVVSSGETTVRVTGRGRGGRNQEFALALAEELAAWHGAVAMTSAGTDGIDGPTDAAGGIVDSTSVARMQAQGLAAAGDYLADNDSYACFQALGDLLQTGRTDTNVGDLQVLLYAPAAGGGSTS